MVNNKNTRYAIHDTRYDILIEFCLIFLIIFTPLAYGAVQPWAIAVIEITAGFMFCIWFFKMLKNGTFEFTHTSINIFIFLLILYTSFQLLPLFSRYAIRDTRYAIHSLYNWSTKTELLKIIAYSMIFLVTLNTIKTKQQITRILSITIAIGFSMSVFYLIRYFGVDAPRGLINPDHFSAYLGMIIPLALGLLFTSHKLDYAIRDTRYAIRFLLFFCTITMSAALFFTMSRGGMFSFIFALLIMAGLVLTRKSIKKKGWLISAVLIFIILTIAWLGATPVVERILSVKAEVTSLYFGGRLPIWEGTFKMIKDYPIFGTGLGTFNHIFPQYQPAQIMAKHYTHVHSDILQFLSETGIIFFSLSVVCGLWSVVWLCRRFNSRRAPWAIGMSIGLFGSLASIFAHSFTDFNLHIPANAILLILILVVTLITLNIKEDRFGERVNFKKIYFLFSKRSAVSENTFQNILREIFRVSLYPFISIVFGFYIFIAVRPALADYYYRKAKANKRDTQYAIRNTQYAIRDTQYAIRFDPTNALYHYHLGKLYSERDTRYAIRDTVEV